MAKERNQMLNVVEALATMLVIFIHFPFNGYIGNMVIAVARISVPFFFSVSGYFFYKGDNSREYSSISKKIKHLLSLMLMSEMIYFAYYVALQIRVDGFSFQAVWNVIQSEVINYYLKNIIERLSVFAPPFNGVCWFIGSLIVVYLVVGVIVKKGWQKTAFLCSMVTLGAGMVLGRVLSYLNISTPIQYERILPTLPLPFFLIGYFIRKNELLFNKISDRHYVGLFLLGFMLTLVEQFVGNYTLYIGTVILVVSLIAFCGKHSTHTVHTLPGKIMNHIGGVTSLFIYILHMMVGHTLSVVFDKLFPGIRNQVHIFPVFVCIASCCVAEVFAYARKELLLHGKRK